MEHGKKMILDDFIRDALRAANHAIGDEEPTDQALRILDALRGLRPQEPVRVTSPDRIDYLERVQMAARGVWLGQHPADAVGPQHTATAGVDTPLGRLRATVWKRPWTGRRGQRVVWAAEYYLIELPITVSEIKQAGLAKRPHDRPNRRKRK